MVRKIYLLAATLLLLTLHGYSQQSPVVSNDSIRTSISTQPVVTKGYYSIGRNADKLDKGHTLTMVKTKGSYPAVTKGYHSIGDKQNNAVSWVPVLRKTGKAPVTKGYYSIGSPDSMARP